MSNYVITNETKSYYIQSKSRLDFYFVAGGKTSEKGRLWSSNQGRTRFIFNIDNDCETDKNGTVIISSNLVTITVVGTNGYNHIGVHDTGALLLQAHSERMVYNDLKNKLLAQGWSTDYNVYQVQSTFVHTS
ncbi:uncharacterized protein FTOL_06707 [Fusarium torulosum]|uniref:Uncharacterized protein n=1 Tax=Fusarium torulosum TaxID=33205 RepID=A0AAE8MAB8_9HYPO|nr:uncharacterized protein FTOL_06707 [Fusarium torulosum]